MLSSLFNASLLFSKLTRSWNVPVLWPRLFRLSSRDNLNKAVNLQHPRLKITQSCLFVLTVITLFGQSGFSEDLIPDEAEAEEVASIVPLELNNVQQVQAEIRQAANLPGAKQLLQLLEQPVAVWIDQLHLGVDNAYSPQQMRYFSARISVINRSEEPIKIATAELQLKGWNSIYSPADMNGEYKLMPVRVGRDVFSMNDFATPAEVEIPPSQVASFWIAFTDLENSNQVENLELVVPVRSRETFVLDIREQQRHRLGLSVTQIGPKDCLGLLTIHGVLNPVNAQDLAERLSELTQQNVQRAVIAWGRSAPATTDDLVDWLLHRAAHEVNNQLYTQFPPFEPLRYTALAALPEINAETDYNENHRKLIFSEIGEAALAALEELFSMIDAGYLTKEIRSGHPLSQRAALLALESRQDRQLNDNLFPLLTQLYDTTDEETRPYVLYAIGQQSGDEPIDMLKKIAVSNRSSEAEAAFAALVKSNQPSAATTVRELLLSGSLGISKAKQVEILSRYFRKEWTWYLKESLLDETPAVRIAAMNGFVQVGHPRLDLILREGLKDSSEVVQKTAFQALVERNDPASEVAALNHALSLLATGNVEDDVLTIITRTRDSRAVEIILDLVEQKPTLRDKLIGLLEEVGDIKSVRALLQQLNQFTTHEQVMVYELATTYDLPEQFELARDAIESESDDLQRVGLQMLTSLASNEAAETVGKLLTEEDESRVGQASYALGKMGTKRAGEILRGFREKAYREGQVANLKAASLGLRVWMTHSPGWNAIDSAYYHSNVNNYENAVAYFELAAEIDPELGVAFSGKGNSLLKLNKYPEALIAFEKAYEIDHFDGQAITGIGIVKAIQGQTEPAVKLTVESADKFPEDDVFSYNTACVYGRAIEYLLKTAPDENRQLIQQYQSAAIKSLQKSIEYGFDEFDLMRSDPDIDSLRRLPEFQKLQQ